MDLWNGIVLGWIILLAINVKALQEMQGVGPNVQTVTEEALFFSMPALRQQYQYWICRSCLDI